MLCFYCHGNNWIVASTLGCSNSEVIEVFNSYTYIYIYVHKDTQVAIYTKPFSDMKNQGLKWPNVQAKGSKQLPLLLAPIQLSSNRA